MTSRTRITFAVATISIVAALPSAQGQQPAIKPDSSGYVAANGVDYWFEIRGKGEPLLLLHGGLMSTSGFGPALTKLAENRRVIGVDLQGHGRTALGNRKISLVDIGRDLAVVIQKLGLRQVDVMGYSFGGIAALQLAVQHPALVRRLVVVSAPYARNGFFAEMLPQQAAVGAAMADAMKDSPMYKSYVAIAPRPQDFPRLLDAMGELMRQPYDWSASVKQLTMPVMLVYGDADMVRPEAHRLVLPAARRWAEGRRLDARAHVQEPARHSAGPDALRDRRGADPGHYGSAVPQRSDRRESKHRAAAQVSRAMSSQNVTLPSSLEALANIAGPVVTPDDPAYEQTRAVFYGGIDKRPSAIVRVANVDDVRRVIATARDEGYELAVRSGGHSIVGHSTTDGGIVIDLREMSGIEIDPDARTAWVETGATAHQVTEALAEHGLVDRLRRLGLRRRRRHHAWRRHRVSRAQVRHDDRFAVGGGGGDGGRPASARGCGASSPISSGPFAAEAETSAW